MVITPSKSVLIGENSGNGHPFSFLAICNGFDYSSFPRNAWPGIYTYLSASSASSTGIPGFEITHAYMPESASSLSKVSNIQLVDAIQSLPTSDICIVARDDWETHLHIFNQIRNKYDTIFIDKPLTLSPTELTLFDPYLASGKLRSESALPYDPYSHKLYDFLSSNHDQSITLSLTTSARADRYLIHFVELLNAFNTSILQSSNLVHSFCSLDRQSCTLNLKYNNLSVDIVCDSSVKLGIHVSATTSQESLVYSYINNYQSFKTLLTSLLTLPSAKTQYRALKSIQFVCCFFGYA